MDTDCVEVPICIANDIHSELHLTIIHGLFVNKQR